MNNKKWIFVLVTIIIPCFFLYKSSVVHVNSNFDKPLSLNTPYTGNINFNTNELNIVSCEADLDGDNRNEQLQLVYNRNFLLRVDDKEFIVAKDIEYSPSNIALCPNLDLIDESTGNHKKIIVSFSNKIVDKTDLWIFEYRNKELLPIE